MDEDLDASLVDIVASAVLIVGAQDRLDIAEKIALREKWLDGLADERGASEPASYNHFEAGFARTVPVHPQTDIVHPHRGAVMCRRSQRDLEFARQEREFGVQRQVLAQQLGPQPRILDLARCDPGPLVGGDIAHAIAAGLHAVHAGAGQIGHRVRQFFELDPVELNVLPRGEMAVVAVVAPCHMRKRAQLRRGERSVRDGDP